MKSQVRLLLVSFLLVCGTIGCGGKTEPVVQEPKTAVEKPDTVVSKPDVTDEPGLSGEIVNSIGMKLKLIPAGELMTGQRGKWYTVRLTKPFYLGVTEVTQEQYEKVMGENPSQFKGASNPVERVSWDDATEFCKKLSAEEGKTYRLPTEAEWEYACRAGTTTKFSFGDDASQLGNYAWFRDNSGRKTHPVGQKKPNSWGLYDMHGNVWEWCQDWSGRIWEGSATDPTGPNLGSFRVNRGGSLYENAEICRSAFRWFLPPGGRGEPPVGFRIACVPSGK
jgi:formylglycine-generating enzyme required for sulfatase activity